MQLADVHLLLSKIQIHVKANLTLGQECRFGVKASKARKDQAPCPTSHSYEMTRLRIRSGPPELQGQVLKHWRNRLTYFQFLERP